MSVPTLKLRLSPPWYEEGTRGLLVAGMDSHWAQIGGRRWPTLCVAGSAFSYQHIQSDPTTLDKGVAGHWEKRLFPFVARLGPAGTCCCASNGLGCLSSWVRFSPRFWGCSCLATTLILMWPWITGDILPFNGLGVQGGKLEVDKLGPGVS
jgi:hypothetical protein